MGILSPEALVESRLRAAFKAICANPVLLDDALSRYSEGGAQQVRDFFRDRDIPVLAGWPLKAQQVPCVTVQLRPSDEPADLQGMNVTAWEWEEGGETDMRTAIFRSVVCCTCYGNSQGEATMLALVTKWVLLVMRQQLELDGLMEQTIQVSDFEPIPSMFDQNTPWFLRSVNLTTTHEDSWNVANAPLIAAISVSPYDDRVAQ